MKIHQLIDQLYWVSKFGIPKRRINAEAIFADPALIQNPIFILSTGRCGTEWFTHVLNKSKETVVFHNPNPNLSVQNKFMYQLIKSGNDLHNDVAIQLLFAGREQHFRQAYKTEKRYVETNNHITFFAYGLTKLFPTAKFIHLYRHPGGFVTSGLNRGWFDYNDSATEKIISPISHEDWESYSKVEKISWAWNETNSFIESFKSEYSNSVFSYDFSKRDPQQLIELFDFLDIRVSSRYLIKNLSAKRNTQQKQSYPLYEKWNQKDREGLKAICRELSEKYDYEL